MLSASCGGLVPRDFAQRIRTWADVQDDSQDPIESPSWVVSQGSQHEPSQLFDCTPDSFEGGASQVRQRLEGCTVVSSVSQADERKSMQGQLESSAPAPQPDSGSSSAAAPVIEPVQVFGDTPDSFDEEEAASHLSVFSSEVAANAAAGDRLTNSSDMQNSAPRIPPTNFDATQNAWRAQMLFASAAAIAAATSANNGAVACTPVRRCRRQKRSSLTVAETPGGKRQRPRDNGAVPTKAPTEEDEQRRLQKRHAGVAHVKNSSHYLHLARLRSQGMVVADETPSTPDPTDLDVSKRSWESRVQLWRTLLRRFARGDEEELLSDVGSE